MCLGVCVRMCVRVCEFPCACVGTENAVARRIMNHEYNLWTIHRGICPATSNVCVYPHPCILTDRQK